MQAAPTFALTALMFSRAGNKQPALRSSAVACSLRLRADTRKHSSEMLFMPLTMAPRPRPATPLG